jgi:hypothetical protein
MEDLSVRTFFPLHSTGIANVLDLGGGGWEDALWIKNHGANNAVVIDKRMPEGTPPAGVEAITGDYFDSSVQGRISVMPQFDFIFSCYSLCFNPKEKIIANLPFYFNHIKKGGTFLLLDFTDEETIVTHREDLFNKEWLLEMIDASFSRREIKTQAVFEKEHNHTHHIFQLAAYGKK